MTSFARRRTAGVAFVLTSAAALVSVSHALEISFVNVQSLQGWLLALMIVFLAAYHVRKRIPVLPMGTAAMWLQVHIYAGVATLPVFLMHSGGHVPRGPIEILTGLFYLTVFSTGCLGLLLTRAIPPRLRNRGSEVIFERIPGYIHGIAEAARVADQSVSENSAIHELYAAHLKSFFDRPQNLFRHLIHSRRPRVLLLARVRDARRFVATDEIQVLETLTGLIQQKDNIDYQHAMQSVLKYWLFIHVPMTWALLVMIFFHVITTLSYT